MSEISGAWPGRQLLIPQRIRHRRVELGLTQKQVVSRLARSGVRTTNRALSSVEHGAGIEVAKLPELAAALDCTITYLVGLTSEPHSWEPDPLPASPNRRSAGNARAASERPKRLAAGSADVHAESLIIGDAIPERRARW